MNALTETSIAGEACSASTGGFDLPPELEREIFEATARLHPGTAVKLALLARKTQIWIEKYIYETVVLDFPEHRTDLFLRTIDSRPPEFFARHVKKLYLTCTPQYSAVKRILSVCTDPTNLTCWSNGPLTPKPTGGFTKANGWLLPLLHYPQNLHRLSIKLEDITIAGTLPDFSLPIFQSLTHLEIVNPPDIDLGVLVDWAQLYNLPRLKHLTLGRLVSWEHSYLIPVIRGLLDNCDILQTLVVLTKDLRLITALESEGSTEDPRLVVLPQFHHPKDYPTYWRDVLRGKPDFWDVSDELAVEQKVAKAQTDSDRTDSDVDSM